MPSFQDFTSIVNVEQRKKKPNVIAEIRKNKKRRKS
jgi:hypothetical protein